MNLMREGHPRNIEPDKPVLDLPLDGTDGEELDPRLQPINSKTRTDTTI